jgi:hypothetical protein
MNPFKKLKFSQLFILFFSIFMVLAVLEYYLFEESFQIWSSLIRNSILALVFAALWNEVSKAKNK